MLKNTEDVPFDSGSELKRRVNTRQGDSLAWKLARDVYTLLSVIEGADSQCLKDLISNSKNLADLAPSLGLGNLHPLTSVCVTLN